jgi:hypothetical protein
MWLLGLGAFVDSFHIQSSLPQTSHHLSYQSIDLYQPSSAHRFHQLCLIQLSITTTSLPEPLLSAIFYTNSNMPFFSFILKCYKSHAAAAELDELPPARPLSIEMMLLSTTSYLPITPKPIPQLEVSISSSTSYAMFEHISTARMKLSTNSFISNDAFEDVDLATPTNFAEPHKQLKSTTASPFDEQHEVDNALVVSSSLSHIMDDDNDLHAASCKQLGRVASPFGDEHGLESEPSVEYAPTTHSSVHDYTERAMEYQRGMSCRCPTSPRL